MLPEAHSILWCLGVFVGLWGVTLIVRGLPAPAVRRRRGRGRTMVPARAGDWRLVAGGTVSVAAGCVAVGVGYLVFGWTHGPKQSVEPPIWSSAALGAAAFSVCLMIWAMRGESARSRRCPRCHYDMAGVGLMCPECGFEGKNEADFLRARRRWQVGAAALAMLVASPGLLLVPSYQRHGTVGLMPTWVLIETFERLPRDWVLTRGGEGGSLQGRFWQSELSSSNIARMYTRAERLVASPGTSNVHAARAMYLSHSVPAGRVPREAVRRMVQLVLDPSEKVRSHFDTWAYAPRVLEAAMEHPELVAPHADALAAQLDDGNIHIALTAGALLMAVPEHSATGLKGIVAQATASRAGRFYASAVLQSAAMAGVANEQLIALLRNPDPGVHNAAVAALFRLDLRAGDREALRTLLDDADVSAASRAAEVLMQQGGDQWFMHVLLAASRRDPMGRAVLLATMKGDPAGLATRGALLAAALRSEEAAVRAAAFDLIESLVAVGQDLDEAGAALRELADQEPDAELRRRAAGLAESMEQRVDERR